jgi:hypothetical protein
MGVRLLSTSTYELWRSDTGQTQTYRTEVVEWPTATRKLVQSYYRFYVNNDALDPTDPWPAGIVDLGENTAITGSDEPPLTGSVVRVRMSVKVTGANMSASTTRFKLQYGEQLVTCSAVSLWRDVGALASTTAIWRGTSTPVADGTSLSGNPPTGGDLNLTVSDRAGTFEEENLSSPNPYKVFIGEDIEYDWVIENNGATSTYCFRMVAPDGTPLDTYDYYPTMVTALYSSETRNWRWYDDETNVTPTSPLAAENTAPVDISYDNLLKLRWTISETQGRDGANIKLKLQYSETSDFSTVTDLVEIGDCTATSTWCYADGAGLDNALIASSTLSDADSCLAGVGTGCGTHNESGTSTSSYTHGAYDNAEFEFTLKHAGAKPSTTYFFRAFDVTNNAPIVLGASEAHPSLVTEGATLIFTVSGLGFGTSTEDIVTDATTTSTEVPFGTLVIGTTTEAAQRLTVTTNALNGYHVYAYERQGLLYDTAEIPEVIGTNAVPLDWVTACPVLASGCYGYHTSDGSLSSGSTTRFADPDTYAAFTATSSEIVYSNQPVTGEETDMVYRILVRPEQQAGEYRSTVVYIVIPIH